MAAASSKRGEEVPINACRAFTVLISSTRLLRHPLARSDTADAVHRRVTASAVMADGVGVRGTGLTKVAVVDPSSYEEQLQAKLVGLKSMFAEFNPPEVEVFRSAPTHYR